VLDPQSHRLIVHRNAADGEYRETAVLNEDDLASCSAQTIAVRELLP
jgi:hypothetical protein